MSESSLPQAPTDVCLLLRADAERHWLHREVIPVLRELEARRQPAEEESASAALSYLEAMWNEATTRARATDRAHSELHSGAAHSGSESLSSAAGRYHASVRLLRELIAARVVTIMPEEDRSGGRIEGEDCSGGKIEGEDRSSGRTDGQSLRSGGRAGGSRASRAA